MASTRELTVETNKLQRHEVTFPGSCIREQFSKEKTLKYSWVDCISCQGLFPSHRPSFSYILMKEKNLQLVWNKNWDVKKKRGWLLICLCLGLIGLWYWMSGFFFFFQLENKFPITSSHQAHPFFQVTELDRKEGANKVLIDFVDSERCWLGKK